jgi:protein TonB
MLKSIIKILILLFFTLSFSKLAYSQEDSYLSVAQVIPQPVGGMDAINKHINYPKLAKKAGVTGKVYILAYINENGGVDNTKIVKGIGAGCDEEAANAVKSTKFTPGKNDGVPIKMKLVLGFTFKE